MDQETADYIQRYFSHFFSTNERRAVTHTTFSAKLKTYEREILESRYKEKR